MVGFLPARVRSEKRFRAIRPERVTSYSLLSQRS